MFLLPKVAYASTIATPGSGNAIMYGNSAQAHDQSHGVPSFLVSPGETYTFTYPADDGTYTITEGSNKPRSFASFMDAYYTMSYSQGIIGHVWTWGHYASWAGNGTCITSRYQNEQWNAWGPVNAWYYEGAGSYVVNHVDLCNAWFNARQGTYGWRPGTSDLQIRYPWQLMEAYAWGTSRTYDWGNPCAGSCF